MPLPSTDLYSPAYHAYDLGYHEGWEHTDRDPRPSYTPLERVCYRAGYAEGYNDRAEGEKRGDEEHTRLVGEIVCAHAMKGLDSDACDAARDDARNASDVIVQSYYRRSYDAPWGY